MLLSIVMDICATPLICPRGLYTPSVLAPKLLLTMNFYSFFTLVHPYEAGFIPELSIQYNCEIIEEKDFWYLKITRTVRSPLF